MAPILGIMASQISGHLKPTVTGGTLTSDATYYYRAFTANGTLSVTGGTLSCDLLVIAGGGGGGVFGALTNGAAGSGGGTAGNSSTNATANTGSGGGGSSQNAATGGNGGSGVTIVRYLKTAV